MIWIRFKSLGTGYKGYMIWEMKFITFWNYCNSRTESFHAEYSRFRSCSKFLTIEIFHLRKSVNSTVSWPENSSDILASSREDDLCSFSAADLILLENSYIKTKILFKQRYTLKQEIRKNKLGLSWAKLSSSWDMTLL